jgi:hypothetical protein
MGFASSTYNQHIRQQIWKCFIFDRNVDYTNSSKPTILPVGKYEIKDIKYPWMKGTLTITDNNNGSSGSGGGNSSSGSNLIIGGFYTPTNQVTNRLDNDGGSHPGWLGYYTNEFPKNGFSILDKYNFHYATCKYCPGGFWPDQKAADHTLIIYSTSQLLTQALSKLSKMIWNNVYIYSPNESLLHTFYDI